MTFEAEDLPFETTEEIPKPPDDTSPNDTSQSAGAGKKKGKGPSQATQLVALAAGVDLFHTPDGRAFATLEINGHRETWGVRSKDFLRWLRRAYFQQHECVPNAQALQDALSMLEARAQFEGREEHVHVRVAEKNGATYLDLGDSAWRAIEITAQGWQIVAEPPVRFRRPRGVMPLPEPVRGGQIVELRRFVNVDSDEAFHLLVAWLVGALRPTGPYVILVLQGEQASAKSTTARVLRRLVDPSTALLRRTPRDERDLMIGAQNAWILSFDNLSGLPIWISDAICCLATGGGLSTRELYTDDDEIIFTATRPVMMNGIDAIAVRADLADRSMVLTLPPIAETKRQAEADFWSSFNLAAPRILGALLDGVSAALRNIGNVTLPSRPRMADFALWATAAEPGLGWTPGTFMAAYAGNRAQTVDVSLEADVVAVAVRALLERCPGGAWEGGATELHAALRALLPEQVLRTRDWPQAANALTNRLRRAAPALRAVGVTCEDLPRSGKSGARKLRLTRAAPQPTVSTVSGVGDTGTVAFPASGAAGGPAPGIVGEVAGHRQPPAFGQTPDFPGENGQADSADDADDPPAGRSRVLQPAATSSPAVGPQTLRDPAGLPALADAIIGARRVALAVVASGPDALLDMPRALAVALPSGEIHLVDLFEMGGIGPVADALRRVLIVGHDLKNALGHLMFNLEMEPGQIFDTMVAHKLLDGGLHLEDDSFFTFAAACAAFLGITPPTAPSAPALTDPLPEDFAAQLAMSMRLLLPLEEALRVELQHADLKQVAMLENALIPAVVEMQLAGVLIDRARWAEVVAAWSIEIETLRQSLCTLLGVPNIDNGADVLAALQRLGLPVTRTKSEDLAAYMHIPAVEQLVRYRHLNGFVASAGRSVLRLFERSGVTRVRPTLNQLGAASGRFSCRDPNLLGLPREAEVRGCIQAEPGMRLIVADYAAIELRVLADQIGEQRLIEVFRAGGDPHRLTASLVMDLPEAEVTTEQRQRAKAINFGFAFGMGAESFVAYARKSYGVVLTIEQAAAFKEQYLAAYSGIAGWQRGMQEEMPSDLRTASGRLRYFLDSDDDYGARLSHSIQGTAADGMKQALILLYNHPRFRRLGAKILLVIHDELLVEAPEAHADEVKAIVTRCMIDGMSTFVKAVPILVNADVRTSWAKPTVTSASVPATVATATRNASGAAYPRGSAAAIARGSERRVYEAITDAQIANRFEELEEEWRDER